MSFTVMAIIVNCVFALVLIIGFFVGFWRGVKKSTVNLVCSVIGIIVAFFTTTLVTNAILGIAVTDSDGTVLPLSQVIYNGITSDPSIQDILTKVPNLDKLIAGLPAALMNVVVFILMTIAIEFVMYLIYLVISIAFLRRKKNPDGTKAKVHRTWGGVIGAVKTLVLMVFALMPLTSLCGLAGTLMTEGDYFNASEPAPQTVGAVLAEDGTVPSSSGNIITANLPQEAIDGVNAFNNSAFGFLGGLFGMDDALFDYYSKVEIDGVEVKIRSEIDSYWRVYDAYTQLQKVGSEGFNKNFADVNFEKLDPIVDTILENGLFKSVVANVVYDAIKNFDDENSLIPADSIADYVDVLEAIRASFKEDIAPSTYFAHEIKLVYDSFKLLCKEGVVDELVAAGKNLTEGENVDYLKIIASEENFNALKGTLENVFDLHMVRAGVVPIVNKLLDTMEVEAKLPQNPDEGTWKEIADNFAGILKDVQGLLSEINLEDILSDPMGLLAQKEVEGEGGVTTEVNKYNLDTIFTNLGELLDLFVKNPIFGETVVDKLLSNDSFDLSLPASTQTLYKMDGTAITLTDGKYTYTNVFGDILLPSMKLMQQSKIYKQITDGNGNISVDAINLLEFIADYLGKEEGKDFLVNAILPLIQVEPTKTLLLGKPANGDVAEVKGIFSDMSGVNFKALGEDYDLWKNDLTQLQTILVELYNIKFDNGQTSGIRKLLGGTDDELSKLITEIGSERMKTLVEPLLLAKSTQEKAQDILNLAAESIKTLVASVADINITIPENLTPEQASEVAEIMGGFADVYTEMQNKEGEVKLEDLDTTKVGDLLNTMQENSKEEGSIFGEAYSAMESYVADLAQNKNIEIEKDENNNIDYVALLEKLKNA